MEFAQRTMERRSGETCCRRLKNGKRKIKVKRSSKKKIKKNEKCCRIAVEEGGGKQRRRKENKQQQTCSSYKKRKTIPHPSLSSPPSRAGRKKVIPWSVKRLHRNFIGRGKVVTLLILLSGARHPNTLRKATFHK